MTNTEKFPPPTAGYRAVCFDLDGTLLPMELEEFLGGYFAKLAQFMIARGVNGAAFKQALNDGVKAMTLNDSDRANSEIYWEVFFREIVELMDAAGEENRPGEDWAALFDEFYDTAFGEIGAKVVPDENMVRAVQTLREKGYPLVLATMPLFPMRALEWRCAWSGLQASDFCRLTTFENSTAAKPSLHYYAENLAAMGLAGTDVLMVGNNTVEDLAFAKLGADTYLVTDHMLNPVDLDLEQVRHGSSADFADWVETLPACADPATSIEQSRVSPQRKRAFYDANLVATPEELAAAKEAARAARGAADDIGDAIAGAPDKEIASGESAGQGKPYVPVGMNEALAIDFSAPADNA